MILTHRLIRLIETHSDELAGALLDRIHASSVLPSYSNVPPEELKGRVKEIYEHLGHWLRGGGEADIERRYMDIAVRRFSQKVPLSELIWAIVLTEQNLWDFLTRESSPGFDVEILAEDEMLRMLDAFFDRAIYSAAKGYEKAYAETRGHEMGPDAERTTQCLGKVTTSIN